MHHIVAYFLGSEGPSEPQTPNRTMQSPTRQPQRKANINLSLPYPQHIASSSQGSTSPKSSPFTTGTLQNPFIDIK